MSNPNTCPHHSVVGDNYGETCADCGEVLAGYGYFAEGSRVCKHRWLQDGNGFVCLYCEAWRPAAGTDGEMDE